MRKLWVCVLAAQLAGGLVVSPAASQSESSHASSRSEADEPGGEQRLLPAMPGLTISGVVDPDLYHVGPGDLLQVQMWGRVSRSWVVAVGAEGILSLPGSGALKVAGRTLTEVRRAALQLLAVQFRGVSIDLGLVQPRSFFIYLTGQVQTPGPVIANGVSRIGDILTPAKLLGDASRRRIIVNHTDGTRELADLELFLRTGDGSLNPWLRDGDIINVPVATEFIFAQGALARAGTFELGHRDSLLTLLRLAGDPTPAADANRSLLIRWKDAFVAESLWFGLEDAYARKINPPLRGGEHVYVYYVPKYHAQNEVSIVGEVARPGVYPITQGRHRVSNLVASAGGFLFEADLATIRIFHSTFRGDADPEFDRLIRLTRGEMTDTEYEILKTKLAMRRADFRLDWSRLMRSPELDILLRNGDVVRVDPLVTSVRVEGEVRRPGIIEFDERRTVREYIELAGGFSERAAHGRIRVTGSVTGQSLRARDVQAVAPGDLIWVPERSDVTLWQHLQTLIAVAAQVATLVVVARR